VERGSEGEEGVVLLCLFLSTLSLSTFFLQLTPLLDLSLIFSKKPNSPTLPTVNQTADKPYYFFDGYAHLASGLACGLAGLAAGMAIGVVGDAGVRANAQQPKLFVGMILILIFAEALALYGLIVGIILASKAGTAVPGGGP